MLAASGYLARLFAAFGQLGICIDLVVTVDCGISNAREVTAARQRQIPVAWDDTAPVRSVADPSARAELDLYLRRSARVGDVPLFPAPGRKPRKGKPAPEAPEKPISRDTATKWLVRAERLAVRGVPTSLDTERKARALGIPLASLDEVESLDLTIDGADEIDARFDMIKGGGGALLREKVVASLSRCEVIVVDRAKLVERLGLRFALPLEVVPFARAAVARRLSALGAASTLRRQGGEVARTDNGNELLDCRFPGGIADARRLERELDEIPGAVDELRRRLRDRPVGVAAMHADTTDEG